MDKRLLMIPALALVGACAMAPRIVKEPHPDDNAYVWKPLFDRTLSNAEFKDAAWSYTPEGYLRPSRDLPI